MLIPLADWETAELTRNGVALPLSVRRIGGRVRVVAEWPRSGPGNYRLRYRSGDTVKTSRISVQPAKLTRTAYARLLEDLEFRLPLSVAIGIQRAGGLTGVELPPPNQTTLEAELFRLRRAIRGFDGRPGLCDLLPELACDPHHVLAQTNQWVRRERARRPHPARLVHAFMAGKELDPDGRPLRVLDTRVEHTVDVYENRIIRAFQRQVELRLHRLLMVLAAKKQTDLKGEARSLEAELKHARVRAAFLDGVSDLSRAPDRVTMVLLRRPEYRAALEAYLEFQRSVSVRLEENALDAPLENLPVLYQLWGTLVIIGVLLDVGGRLGFRIAHERIVRRDVGGVFVEVLRGGKPAVVLEHPKSAITVRLIPELSYGNSGTLRSISFIQRPDVTLEVRRPGTPPHLYLFDPKYKLEGELSAEEGSGSTGPKKVDIDKMHAYRDAIRDPAGRRVVRYAAILYPGPPRDFRKVEALPADPEAVESLERSLAVVVERALAGALDAP